MAVNWITPQQLISSTKQESRSIPAGNTFPCTLLPKVCFAFSFAHLQPNLDKEPDLGSVLKQLRGRVVPTPWFEQYCKEYFQLVVNSEHEVRLFPFPTYPQLFLHPVAVLSVTTTGDSSASKTFNNLFETFRQKCPNFIDLNVLRIYAFVHDESEAGVKGGSDSEVEATRKK